MWCERPSRIAKGQHVRRVPRGGSVYLVLLGEPKCMRVHWTDAGSLPCVGAACPSCEAGVAARVRGYFPALEHGKGGWVPIVLELPESFLVDIDAPLRQVLQFRRVGTGARSRVEFTRVAQPPGFQAPPAFDVVPAVEAMWRRFCPARDAGVKRGKKTPSGN